MPAVDERGVTVAVPERGRGAVIAHALGARGTCAVVPGAGSVGLAGLTCGDAVEPMTGIEPACPAWEAGALPLSYIGLQR